MSLRLFCLLMNRVRICTVWIGEGHVSPPQKPGYLDCPISAEYFAGQYLPAHCGWFAGRGMAVAHRDWLGSGAVRSAGSCGAVVAQAAVLVEKRGGQEGV